MRRAQGVALDVGVVVVVVGVGGACGAGDGGGGGGGSGGRGMVWWGGGSGSRADIDGSLPRKMLEVCPYGVGGFLLCVAILCCR